MAHSPKAVIKLNKAYKALRDATGESGNPAIIDAMTLVSHIADDEAGKMNSLKAIDKFTSKIESVLLKSK